MIYYVILAPNGVNASDANLKHCLLKGIPIIVKKRIIPKATYPNVNSQPNNIIQIILAIGCFPKWVLTSVPNGSADNLANLKHCIENGIPIIVIPHNIPINNQYKLDHKPMMINHKTLPKVFINPSLKYNKINKN